MAWRRGAREIHKHRSGSGYEWLPVVPSHKAFGHLAVQCRPHTHQPRPGSLVGRRSVLIPDSGLGTHIALSGA
jgi:hypothetical protein